MLWKAMSALSSATTALDREVAAWHAEPFSFLERTPFGSKTFDMEFDACCRESVRFVDSFHPIVVIDAMPWIVSARGAPESVSTCRFYQLDSKGSVLWWCDIVHSEAFEEFVNETTDFYERFYRKARARRFL